MLKVKSKIWLEKNKKIVFGEGRLVLLKEIEKAGSISSAAEKLKMSFRHAWSILTSTEKNLGIKLLEKRKGGLRGGGSKLTPQAKLMMSGFEKLNKAVKSFTDKKWKDLKL